MRLAKIVFVTRNDDTIELINMEDWIIQLLINGNDVGSIMCPQKDRKSLEEDNNFHRMIIDRIKEYVKFEWAEKEYLLQDLKEIVPSLV